MARICPNHRLLCPGLLPDLEVRFKVTIVPSPSLQHVTHYVLLVRCPPHLANLVRERRLATEVWMRQVKLHTKRYT